MIFTDKRIALKSGTALIFPGMKCYIEGEAGRGSNAIVYRGYYEDAFTANRRHNVLIKELFPYHEKGEIYRREDMSIRASEAGKAVMETHSQSFALGNSIHLRLRELHPADIGGNINTYALNSTYYTILDFAGGRTLDAELAAPSPPLRALARRMIGVLEALNIFHESGYLHLDVSPDNILLLGEGEKERVELIDFNSALAVADISEGNDFLYSAKQGYAAPEIRSRDIASIGKSADIYSATAVFYRCLTGAPLSRMQQSGVRAIDISASPYLNIAPETVKSMVKHIVATGLSAAVARRYRAASDMLADLRELIDRIDGVGVTHWALWEASRRFIARELRENPALQYIAEPAALYPARLTGGEEVSALLEKKRAVALTGGGGMGKTTLLLRAALTESRAYRRDRPVVMYISLYGYSPGDKTYVRDALLAKLRFKPETGSYADARHALEQLFQKPLKTRTGDKPVICLLLDGYNEISGDAAQLNAEIARLTRMPGVSLVVASRGAPRELEFEEWQTSPLDDGDINEILARQGLLTPESPELRALLTNPMMLSLFIRTCLDSGERPVIQTREQLISAFLSALLDKEIRALPDDSPEKWRLEAAIDCVYPMIAGLESRKRRGVTSFELLNMMNKLYSRLNTRAFAALFPKWVGRASDIKGDAKDGEAFFGLIINDLLWRRLGLLYQDENGAYRMAHQEFRDMLAPRARQIRKTLERRGKFRALSAATLFIAALICGYALVPKQTPYDAKKALSALDCAQAAFMTLNTQYATLQNLLTAEEPDFERARAELKSNHFLLYFDEDGDGSAARELTQITDALLKTGERMPWNDMDFDAARLIEMAELPGARAQTYADCVNRLELVHAKGTPGEYAEYRALMDSALRADAALAAAYYQLVVSARAREMAAWEATHAGKAHAGAFNRLDEGRGFAKEILIFESPDWESASLEKLITQLNRAQDMQREAWRAVGLSETYEKLRRE